MDVLEIVVLLVVELAEVTRSISTSEKPMIALSGVRSSCDIAGEERRLVLVGDLELGDSCRRISLNRRAFWMAITA